MYLPFGNLMTAMITPFKSDLSIDFDEAIKIANYLADNGTQTILVSGTTGESPTISHEEEYDFWQLIKKSVGNRVKVVAGTGSNATSTSISSTQMAEKLGLDGAMIVVPYYNKPSQEGIYLHFKTIAENTSLPLIIYNIPGRTSKNLEIDTLQRLAELKNYIALKAACGNLEQIAKMRQVTDPNAFAIYSGDDALTLEILARGGCGVISVASHIIGKEILAMVEMYLSGKKEEAMAMHKKLLPIFEVLFITSNPAPVKAAMSMLGFKTDFLRLPMIPANELEKTKIKSVLQACNLIR